MTTHDLEKTIALFQTANIETMRVVLVSILREMSDFGGKPFEGLPLSLARHLGKVAETLCADAAPNRTPESSAPHVRLVAENLEHLSKALADHFSTEWERLN